MGITEGISVTIAQHNGGTPSFDQLWASDSEAPKLDIYYREGISDLERRLEKWLEKSSAQFDLQAIGDDYTLRLDVSRSWPTRLDGLLKNKVQDFLVHTVTAGWLNDFEGVSVKQDYQAMAAQDLNDIVYIVGLKSFGFVEKERAGESDKDAESDGSAQGRCTDGEKKEETKTGVTEERASDAEKGDNPYTVEAGERKTDEGGAEAAAEQQRTERKADADKDGNPYTVEAGERKADEENAGAAAQQPHTERKADADKTDNLSFEAGERKADEESDKAAAQQPQTERKEDADKVDNLSFEAGERKADEESDEAAAEQLHTERKEDADKTGGQHTHADERSSDDVKATSDYPMHAAERHSKSDTESGDVRFEADAGGRNTDDDTVDIRHDYTDWSGTSPLIWEKAFETS